MLGKEGFDQWAGNYDERISQDSTGYPFEGYYDVLAYVHSLIDNPVEKKILDIGVGTGLLSYLLYKRGSQIWGLDFSEKMIERAQRKMPKASFFQHDFSRGLPDEVSTMKFDYIISSYAIHHLNDEGKIKLVEELKTILKDTGKIIIADVAFTNREELEACKKQYQGHWDNQEAYIVADSLMTVLENAGWQCEYHQVSFCGGVLDLNPEAKA